MARRRIQCGVSCVGGRSKWIGGSLQRSTGCPVLQAFESAYEASEGLIGGVVIEPDEEGRFVLEFLWYDVDEIRS